MENNPLQIQVLTNLNCNLNCSYCYENKGRGANDILAIRAFILARMSELSAGEERDVNLDFIGGESLLYPGLLDEACEWAQRVFQSTGARGRLIVSLSTNGTLIAEDKEVQAFLRKWRPNVGFSIDGTKAIHDACRVDKEGAGSYDRAVAGYSWLRKNLPCVYTGAKATYTHATIQYYAAGVINLIELGFTDIAANVVFEELWDKADAVPIYEQFRIIADYLFEHGLEEKVHLLQLNNAEIDMKNYSADSGPCSSNHCGSCVQMMCLGFDGLIYGCNRFCTMKKPLSVGYLNTEHKIEITSFGREFIKGVSEQWKQWPDECAACPYRLQCPSCAAIPYEGEGPVVFYSKKPQCGFTQAMVAARLYFRKKLLDAEEEG